MRRLILAGLIFLGIGVVCWVCVRPGSDEQARASFILSAGLPLIMAAGYVWGAAACGFLGLIFLTAVAGLAVQGAPFGFWFGPGLGFLGIGGWICTQWLTYRRSLAVSQRNISHFKNAWGTIQANQSELSSAIHVEEESIQEIGRLFGISKRFLAILNLEEALEIVEEVLTKEFPHLSEAERQKQVSRIQSAVESGELTAQALTDPLPMGVGDAHLRERWWIVSGQLALGLQRVARYRQVQESATHDGLTGLLTRRYFRQRLHEEIGRTLRRKVHLAFLMIDLDHFKKVNDTYGHLVGDVVLREISGLIQGSVREIDLISRYGGEEFAVALPEMDIEFAVQVANRIREMIELKVIRAYDEEVRVTVSIGVALCPDAARTTESLIEQADQAMYRAKSSGRNKVVSV